MPLPSVELIDRRVHDLLHAGCRELSRKRDAAAAASATRTAHQGAPVLAVEAASAAATCATGTVDKCVTVATCKTPARASLARGAPTTAVKASTDSYWILAHQDSDGSTRASVAAPPTVRVRDAVLCQDANAKHVKMHVLGWNTSQAVLGCMVRGDTHLRVLDTCDFPRDTLSQVKRMQANVRVAYKHAYASEHFLASTYVRPDGSEQNVFFIAELSESRGGPLLGYTCNQVMPCLAPPALSCVARCVVLCCGALRCVATLPCSRQPCPALPLPYRAPMPFPLVMSMPTLARARLSSSRAA